MNLPTRTKTQPPHFGEDGYLDFLRTHLYNRFVWWGGRPRRRQAEPLMTLIRLEREDAYNQALNNIEKPTPAMKQRIEAARKKGPTVVTRN